MCFSHLIFFIFRWQKEKSLITSELVWLSCRETCTLTWRRTSVEHRFATPTPHSNTRALLLRFGWPWRFSWPHRFYAVSYYLNVGVPSQSNLAAFYLLWIFWVVILFINFLNVTIGNAFVLLLLFDTWITAWIHPDVTWPRQYNVGFHVSKHFYWNSLISFHVYLFF